MERQEISELSQALPEFAPGPKAGIDFSRRGAAVWPSWRIMEEIEDVCSVSRQFILDNTGYFIDFIDFIV